MNKTAKCKTKPAKCKLNKTAKCLIHKVGNKTCCTNKIPGQSWCWKTSSVKNVCAHMKKIWNVDWSKAKRKHAV
jgi:abortive infection bacteriophage resistance protein